MNLKREVKKWKRSIILILVIFFIVGLGYGTYLLFEEPMGKDAIWPALAVSCFIALLIVALIGYIGREFVKLAIDKVFYKNGFFTILINSSGQAVLDFGPPTRNFIYQSGDDKIPDLELTLGPTSFFVGTSPLHIGTDSSVYSVDIKNVIYQKLTNLFVDAGRFKKELLYALESSIDANQEEFFVKNEDGQILKDPHGYPQWNKQKQGVLKDLMTFDFQRLFPLTTMSIDYQGGLSQALMTGIRIGQLKSFEELLKKPAVMATGALVLLCCLIAGAFAYQTYEKLSEVQPVVNNTYTNSSNTILKIDELKAKYDESLINRNTDLLPKSTGVLEPGGG